MKQDRPFRSLSRSEQISVLAMSLLALIPVFIICAGYVLTTAPFFPPVAIMPSFGLLLFLLFSLYRPTQLPLIWTLPIGVFADLMLSMPVGVNALGLPLFMIALTYVEFEDEAHSLGRGLGTGRALHSDLPAAYMDAVQIFGAGGPAAAVHDAGRGDHRGISARRLPVR